MKIVPVTGLFMMFIVYDQSSLYIVSVDSFCQAGALLPTVR